MSARVIDLGPVDDVLGQAGRAVVKLPGSDLHLVVARVGATVFAFESACPHLGRSLADAVITPRGITCRAHAICFDLLTGAARRGSSSVTRLGGARLPVYQAWVERGRICVAVPR
jgi:nitrite reductase/ring-hydroxylating ferredoxin subunit